jgi:hypothetical protein
MTIDEARRDYERGRRHGRVWTTCENARMDHVFMEDALLPHHSGYWWAGVDDGLQEGYAVLEVAGSPDRALEIFKRYI